MKKIWTFLVNHLKQDFHPRVYIVTGLFLAISLWWNYTYDIEDGFLDRQRGVSKFLFYYLFYATAYYFVLLVSSAFQKKDRAFWKQKSFWIKSTLGLAALSLDSSVPFLRPFIHDIFHSQLQYWAYKVSVNLVSFFTVILPLLTFYFLKERKAGHLYGLNAKQFDTRPYFTMLLIMLPLIIAASFHPSFVKQYPMYKSSSAHHFLGIPEWATVLTYETAYGLDFVTVEFLFRGFFAIGMASVLGRRAVLAMAVIYCFLHFGKPSGEAISSIFGGYILGVIAYETKSIWGGIIVHVGIAWMMEMVAFIQRIT